MTKQNIRQEEDLLGTREIPLHVYYGIHTVRAIENFTISHTKIRDIPELIQAMVLVKKAAALANKELKVIPSHIADTIVKACNLLLYDEKYQDQFPIDVFQGGAGTSVNMNINEVIANIGLELMGHQKGEYNYLHPNDHVNQCQSTNDAYPTGLRIAIYTLLQKLITNLTKLVDSFKKKSNEFTNILKMGRTQLQDAVPMTLGQEFKAFQISLNEEINNIRDSSKFLLEVNLGATAIGTGLNTPKEYQQLVVKNLISVTNLPCRTPEDLIEATSDCGDYVMVHSVLKRLAVKLSKICNDLRLLSSGPRAGLNEIKLPELQAGSSIMPAKINPVIPEVVNQVCFKVIGNDTCVTFASEAGQLQLNVMEPVIGQSLFESINILSNACSTLKDKCISGITANQRVCESYVLNSIGIITYLNPYIGHHNGDIVGKICASTGKSVREVVLELELLNAEALDKLLSIKNLMDPSYKELHLLKYQPSH
ncbi:MAG: aspartate ammonia-lyase [Candidatus Dasytiphilus stammeri]